MAWLGRYDDNIVGCTQENKEGLSKGAVLVEDVNKTQNDIANDFVQLGQLLVSARKKANLTRAQIIEKLKIKEYYLDAIENGRLDLLNLPMPFLRGFLRGYCELVGAKNIWREYDSLTSPKTIGVKTSHNQINEIQKGSELYRVTTSVKKSRFFIVSFLLVLVLLAVYFVYQLKGDIASQIISPAEIIMGLNPLDKINTEGQTKKVNVQNENLESEVATIEKNDDREQTTPENETTLEGNTNLSSETKGITEEKKKSTTGVFASFAWLDNNNDSETKIKEKQTKDSTTNNKDVTNVSALPPLDKRVITVKALNVLWIGVRTQNRRIFQGLMRKGEVKNFTVESVPVTIRYGKGDRALVTWNGVEKLVSNEAKPITIKYTLEE